MPTCLLNFYSMASYFYALFSFSFYSIRAEEWDLCIIISPAMHCKAIKFQQHAGAAAEKKKSCELEAHFWNAIWSASAVIFIITTKRIAIMCERRCSFSILRILVLKSNWWFYIPFGCSLNVRRYNHWKRVYIRFGSQICIFVCLFACLDGWLIFCVFVLRHCNRMCCNIKVQSFWL